MSRESLKNSKSGKELYEKKQFWTGNILKRTIMNRTSLVKGQLEKENKLKNGNSGKESFLKGQS